MNTSQSQCHAPNVDDVLSRGSRQLVATLPATEPYDAGAASKRLFGGRLVEIAAQMCGGLCVSNHHLDHAFGGRK